MKRNIKKLKNESGAALIAVLFISILLVTASAFLLNAVGNNSRNSSDVLAETKAFYAAESGLQAAINIFRNDSTLSSPYTYAVGDPQLTTKLAYTTVNGVSQVLVGTNSGYSVNVVDPDNSGASTTFSTDGEFAQADGFTFAPTRVFGTAPNTTTLSYIGAPSSTVTHPMAGRTFGSFHIISTGTGAALSDVRLRVNFRMTSPRQAVRSFNGKFVGSTRIITFDAKDTDGDSDLDYVFSLMGLNNLFVCQFASCTTTNAFNIAIPAPVVTDQSVQIYGKMDPVEPYRLKLQVTGYARPGNAKKQLEAVIQRNFLNGLGSSAAISMVGPNPVFDPGNSNNMDIAGGSNPSITVSDSTGLNTVVTALTGPPNRLANVTPPPQIAGPDLPDWQQNTTAMHTFITQLKQAAQNSGRYYANGAAPPNFGNFGAGTGITFCDGDCSMGGNSEGGGILVITGTFYTSGNPRFNGLVLAVGPGGIERSGGGNQIFTGNVVVAPYNPNNLAASWGNPRYIQNGGPGDTINSDVAVDSALDGTQAITDFVLGIAEK